MEWFSQSYKEDRGTYFQVSMSLLKTLSTHNFVTSYPCVVPRPAGFCYVIAFSYFTVEIFGRKQLPSVLWLLQNLLRILQKRRFSCSDISVSSDQVAKKVTYIFA